MRTYNFISLFIFMLFIVPKSTGQELVDEAVNQEINAIRTSADRFGSGLSFYDFNNDGWDDITIPFENDSIVFYKNVNGHFIKIGSLLYSEGQIRELLWVDYDNDGLIDLCASYYDIGVRLYQNQGQFTFIDRTVSAGLENTPSKSYGISFADPDMDGDLDLYVANYEHLTTTNNVNKYYINNGNGQFTELGVQSGIDNGYQVSFMGVWFDYNNDNNIDLHVINDRYLYNDALYKNNGNGTFIDIADSAGIANSGKNPMTSSVSDFDNDGYQDVFVTDFNHVNSFSGIAYFNKLFKNQNGVNFNNVAPSMVLDTGYYSWGALWVDYNNDGYEDLYVCTSEIPSNLPDQTSMFYRNNGGNSFSVINDSIIGDITASSVSAVKGDINNDGFYDIVVLNYDDFPNVLTNTGNDNKYIKITPVLSGSNRQAIGSKVHVYAGGLSQLQTVFCGSGMCAQNSQHMIFGINNVSFVDSVIVNFPNGTTIKKYNLETNTSYTIIDEVIINVELLQGIDTLTLCSGQDTLIGIPGYTNYLWNTGSTDSMIVISSSGEYQFTALDSNNSTIQSNSVYVNIPPSLSYQEVVNYPPCGSNEYGSAEIVFNNLSDTSSSILWSNGSTDYFNDSLITGTYSYEINTIENCAYAGDITIISNPLFDVETYTTPFTNQSGGTVQLTPFGGEAPYSYYMDTLMIDSFIDSLNPGIYEVEVIDGNGCSNVVTFTIADQSNTASLIGMTSNDSKIYFYNDYLWVCINQNEQVQHVEIKDMTGRKVVLNNEWFLVSEKCRKIKVPVSAGLYHVQVITDKQEIKLPVFIK